MPDPLSPLASPVMSHPNSREKSFGYLSALESAEHGFFGGYLIVTPQGRPLEFHCTAPIQPSRAQTILYGATLRPFLIGDQICRALLDAAKVQPIVVLTDSDAALQANARFPMPLALVTDGAAIDQPASIGEFTFKEWRLRLPAGRERDEQQIVDALTQLAQQVNLVEPFARIHDAIREAQRIGGRDAEAHDQAA
jgi:hypothetical protein